ncbi:MAG: hypothetical protein ABSA97_06955 [Verrucomicrobiia bacterium]
MKIARVSRGPWRLKAFIDKQGHPVTSRFLVVRPLDKRWKLDVLWAICNSPIANAYSYAFSGKRDVLAGLMKDMPVPRLESVDLHPLLKLVRSYLRIARALREGTLDVVQAEKLRILHWRIDAEVLRLYVLPSRLEHQVLHLFSGATRRGVPFRQAEYVPKNFADDFSLRDLLAITADWEQTNERRARLLLKQERKTIRPQEKEELEHLQNLTDVRIRLVTPLPLAELEANRTGRLLVKALRLDNYDYTRMREQIIGILRSLLANDRPRFVSMMGFPPDIPDLAALNPEGNTRPTGLEQSFHALRMRGQLPEAY